MNPIQQTPLAPRRRFPLVAGVIGLCLAVGFGCDPPGADDPGRFDHMDKTDLTINDQTFRAWVAKTTDDIRSGFMFVKPEQLETLPDGKEPGMLFIFDRDRPASNGFWMKNVPVPLDIAFIRSDGTIVTIRTMAPFDHRSTYATESYRYTLEVSGGLFKKLGITEGDTIQIPDSVLNNDV